MDSKCKISFFLYIFCKKNSFIKKTIPVFFSNHLRQPWNNLKVKGKEVITFCFRDIAKLR